MGAGFYHLLVGAGLHNLSVVKDMRDRVLKLTWAKRDRVIFSLD
jgi:hypothetical protein